MRHGTFDVQNWSTHCLRTIRLLAGGFKEVMSVKISLQSTYSYAKGIEGCEVKIAVEFCDEFGQYFALSRSEAYIEKGNYSL